MAGIMALSPQTTVLPNVFFGVGSSMKQASRCEELEEMGYGAVVVPSCCFVVRKRIR